MNVSSSLIVKLRQSWPTTPRRRVLIIWKLRANIPSSHVPRRIFTIARTKQPWKLGVWKWQVLRISFEFCTYPQLFFRIRPSVFCDVPPRCPWQHEDTNEHLGCPHQHATPTITVDGPGSTTIRRYTRNRRRKRWTTSKEISQVEGVESSSLGEKPPR
jgi:hypothetical protein